MARAAATGGRLCLGVLSGGERHDRHDAPTPAGHVDHPAVSRDLVEDVRHVLAEFLDANFPGLFLHDTHGNRCTLVDMDRSSTLQLVKPIGPGHNRPDLKCHHRVIYGLTCDEYEAMRSRADGRCEICRVDEKETRRGFLVVDHFHGWAPGSSFIRGMLCDWCNKSVMQAYDGLKPWGKQRHYEEAAREYERNSWQRPSAVALREMAERTEMLPIAIREPRPRLPRPRPRWQSVPDSIEMPLRRGQMVIAAKLRRHLTADQLARLAELLTEEG